MRVIVADVIPQALHKAGIYEMFVSDRPQALQELVDDVQQVVRPAITPKQYASLQGSQSSKY